MPTPTWFRRYGAVAAAGGAVLATLGDFGQLWVVNAARVELALTAPPADTIVPATLLGAIGISLYGFGYCALALSAGAASAHAAGLTMIAGPAFAALGAAVHAATGIQIAGNQGGIRSGADPWTGLLGAGPILLSLWVIAGLLFVVAAGAALCLARNNKERARNPLVLTLVIAAAAPLLGLPWRDFVGPASVNLAHLVFFVALAASPPQGVAHEFASTSLPVR